jgi:hypothetical protein
MLFYPLSSIIAILFNHFFALYHLQFGLRCEKHLMLLHTYRKITVLLWRNMSVV